MGGKLSILFIGTADEADHLRELIRDSQYRGSRVTHAKNFAAASLTKHYSLVISNFADGLETLSSIKEAFPHAPVLYYGDNEELADHAVILGAQDYLPKEELDAHHFTRIVNFAREREEHQLKLREKIFTDDLTGIYNRRGFMTLMQQQMELTKRSNQGFMLFMFDLDYFKQINDEHGHPAGDEALTRTAEALTKSFRAHDIVARIGGDEFAVLALNSKPEVKEVFKQNLFDRLRELNKENRPYNISCSIGSVYYSGNHETIKDLLMAVDKDLYKDKRRRHQVLARGD